MVIFYTKYPTIFRASLRSAIFLSAPPNLKSWIRPWTLQQKYPHSQALRVNRTLSTELGEKQETAWNTVLS